MPFVEIHPEENDWIRIAVTNDGEISIIVAKNIREKYFTITPSVLLAGYRKVGVFIDKDNKLLGLKPQHDGYKIDNKGRIWVSKLKPYGIVPKIYNTKWNESQQMIISQIILKEESSNDHNEEDNL